VFIGSTDAAAFSWRIRRFRATRIVLLQERRVQNRVPRCIRTLWSQCTAKPPMLITVDDAECSVIHASTRKPILLSNGRSSTWWQPISGGSYVVGIIGYYPLAWNVTAEQLGHPFFFSLFACMDNGQYWSKRPSNRLTRSRSLRSDFLCKATADTGRPGNSEIETHTEISVSQKWCGTVAVNLTNSIWCGCASWSHQLCRGGAGPINLRSGTSRFPVNLVCANAKFLGR